MDRHHQSARHRRASRSKDQKNPHSTKPPHSLQDIGHRINEVHDPEFFKPRESLKPILQKSAPQDENLYVRNWLAQTKDKPSRGRSSVLHVVDNRPSHRNSKETVRLARRATDTLEGPAEYHPKRERHHISSDSSLLEPTKKFKTQKSKDDLIMGGEALSKVEEPHHPSKRRKIQHQDSHLPNNQPSPSPQRKATYEKRARHKTREDRYDPKVKKSQKISKESKRKEKLKSKAKRQVKKSGEEIMRQFASKSVAQDRLTMRPANKLGLFNNGRASSPSGRHGLPDLAFSEMDFLLRRTAPRKLLDKRDKTPSKGREKGRRKSLRANEEISTFFGPRSVSPGHLNLQDGRRNPQTSPTNLCTEDRSSAVHAYGQSLESKENPSVSRHSRSYIRQISEGSSDIHSNDYTSSNNHPEQRKETPSKVTEVFTRSTSEASPGVGLNAGHKKRIERRAPSPSPESIWTSIKATGVFKGTGIEPSLGLLGAQGASSPDVPPRKHFRIQSGVPRRTEHAPNSDDLSTSDVSPIQFNQLSRHHEAGKSSPGSSNRRGTTNDAIQRYRDENVPCASSIPAPDGPNRNPDMVDSFSKAEVPALSRSALPPTAQIAPLTRTQIAQEARLARPSTTLPLVKASESVLTENDAESAVIGQDLQHEEQMRRLESLGLDIVPYPPNEHSQRPDLDMKRNSSQQARKIHRKQTASPSVVFRQAALPVSGAYAAEVGNAHTGNNKPTERDRAPDDHSEAPYLKQRSPMRSWIGQRFQAHQPNHEMAPAPHSLYMQQMEHDFVMQHPYHEDDAEHAMFDRNNIANIVNEPVIQDARYDMPYEYNDQASAQYQHGDDLDFFEEPSATNYELYNHGEMEYDQMVEQHDYVDRYGEGGPHESDYPQADDQAIGASYMLGSKDLGLEGVSNERTISNAIRGFWQPQSRF